MPSPTPVMEFVSPPVSNFNVQGKRVGMVVYSSYPADPRPRRAVDALLEQGMSVDLICLGEEGGPKSEKIGEFNVRRVSITHRRGGVLLYAYQYISFIVIAAVILAVRSAKRRYDLVYVHNMPDVLVVSALIPKLFGAKVILDMHDPMPELMMTIFNCGKDSLKVRMVKMLEKWSIGRADLVITVNSVCRRIFAARSRTEKISVVMNSPDEKIFQFRPSGAAKSAGERFVIMYHGSIIERNGLDLAVEAFAQARQTIPLAELRIYGRSNPFLERVMENARRRGLEDSVRFLGPKSLEQLVAEIEQCDVGIIPNHRNAFTEINTPTRLFEYLALGKPVIAPDAPGIQDYFRPGSLVFFETGSAEQLARKIEYVYAHYPEALETVAEGQRVYEAHTWKRERENLTNLVCNLLTPENTRRVV